MSYRTEVLADNPVGYWRLGESTGTVATDLSASALNGTYSGVYTQGVTGALSGSPDTAVTFNGGNVAFTGQTTGGAPLFLSTGTVEAWVKTSDADANYHGIFVKANAYAIFVRNSQLLTYDYSGGGDRASGVTVADGTYHHVALTFDSGVSNGSQLYVDGATAGAAFTMAILNQASEPFIALGPDVLHGDIDEVAVFSTVLSGARLAAHFNAADDPEVGPRATSGTFAPQIATRAWF